MSLKKHQLKCASCGKILDMRDASIILHGWIENGKDICYDGKISYSSSKEKDKPILYDKNKNEINLN